VFVKPCNKQLNLFSWNVFRISYIFRLSALWCT